MKVLLSDQGYVVSYALEGELLDAVEAAEPSDLSHFEEYFTAYRVQDGALVFDDGRCGTGRGGENRIPAAAADGVLSRHQPGAAVV